MYKILKNRYAISTIVGGFFFLVIMIGAFTAIFTAIKFQSDIFDIQRYVSDQELRKVKESFSVIASVDTGKNLCSEKQCFPLTVTIQNTGSIPVEIVDLWIINKTATYPATRFDIDNSLIPINSVSNILEDKTLSMYEGAYDIKVVSSLGTIEIVDISVSSSSNSPLQVEIFITPPDIISGHNATLVMHVYNKGSTKLVNVTPTSDPPEISPSDALVYSSLTSLPSIDLEPSESFVFVWDLVIVGEKSDTIKFTNSVSALDLDNNSITSNEDSDILNIFDIYDGKGDEDGHDGKGDKD